MGYGFKCSSDLTFLEKVEMLCLWLTFGTLPFFVLGAVVGLIAGLQKMFGNPSSFLQTALVASLILTVPSGIGIFGYSIAWTLAGGIKLLQRVV